MGTVRGPIIHVAALTLVLAAMLVSSLVPVGWMPGASAGSPLVICTGSGPLHVPATGSGKPLSHHTGGTTLCPFGAAPHFATLASPSMAAIPVAHPTSVAAVVFFERYSDTPRLDAHPPRAPPAIA